MGNASKNTILENFLVELHEKYKPLKEGRLANYIPELTKANPDWFGICVVTVDGQVYTVGDCEQLFTIQSISKAFVYGLALEAHGRDYVLTRVGVEPTGDAFNSIQVDESSKRPYNPMVNAGAIATTSLIKGSSPSDRLNRLLDMFGRYVGHDLFVDMPVFLSERTSGHRNRAMAYLMLNFGMIDKKIDEALDLYFQQCSVTVNPQKMGIGVFSPPLDSHGSSVRGLKVCEDLSDRFGLHLFDLHMDSAQFFDTLLEPPLANSDRPVEPTS